MNRIEINVLTGEQKTIQLTADEIAQAQNTEAERLAAIPYSVKRAAEYPSIGDQLDALWKGGDAAAEMLAKVQAVKAKYPKGVA